jgi:hypothetical protein
MAAVRRLVEWTFTTYEEGNNDGDGMDAYDLATGEWKAVDGGFQKDCFRNFGVSSHTITLLPFISLLFTL